MPFDSLNFGNPGDLPEPRRDPRANIHANFARVLRAIGTPRRTVLQVHQVHGREVAAMPGPGQPATVTSEWTPGRFAAPADGSEPVAFLDGPRADAIVTADPSTLAVVRVADCCPILLAAPDGSVVAAVHAGWRGVIDGVVLGAIGRIIQLAPRCSPGDVLAALGPCIGPEQFEVGPEVVAAFDSAFPPRTDDQLAAGVAVVARRVPATASNGAKGFVNLHAALRRQLLAAGLRADRIDALPHCTAVDAGRFFSHRRDRGVTGRMIGVIGPRSGSG